MLFPQLPLEVHRGLSLAMDLGRAVEAPFPYGATVKVWGSEAGLALPAESSALALTV